MTLQSSRPQEALTSASTPVPEANTHYEEVAPSEQPLSLEVSAEELQAREAQKQARQQELDDKKVDRSRPRFSMKTKVISGLVAAAVTAGTIVGFVKANENNTAPELDTNPGAGEQLGERPVDDILPPETDIPAPEAKSNAKELVANAPENVKPYLAMSETDFFALPVTEQSIMVSYLMSDMDLFANEWRNQTGDSNDIYTPASSSNTPDQALEWTRWLKAKALSFDTVTAKKIIAFSNINGAGSSYYTTWAKQADLASNRSVAGMAESHAFPNATVLSNGELYSNGQFNCYDIVASYPGVESTGASLCQRTLPSYDGSTWSVWQDNN